MSMELVPMGGDEVLPTVPEQALRVCDGGVPLETTAASVKLLLGIIEQLRNASDCTRYLQGGLLLRLKQKELWKMAYPELPWWEFVERRVGLNVRTVWALMSIFERATTLGLTPERLAQVGWSKARDILQIARHETIEEWLAKAQALTREELRTEVKKAKASEPVREAPPETYETLSLRVTTEARQNIMDAIEQATNIIDKTVPMPQGAALDYVCLDWRANHLDTKERSLVWHLAQLERAYGGVALRAAVAAYGKEEAGHE